MIKYGKRKRRGGTIHPVADSDKNISKSNVRFQASKEISRTMHQSCLDYSIWMYKGIWEELAKK